MSGRSSEFVKSPNKGGKGASKIGRFSVDSQKSVKFDPAGIDETALLELLGAASRGRVAVLFGFNKSGANVVLYCEGESLTEQFVDVKDFNQYLVGLTSKIADYAEEQGW